MIRSYAIQTVDHSSSERYRQSDRCRVSVGLGGEEKSNISIPQSPKERWRILSVVSFLPLLRASKFEREIISRMERNNDCGGGVDHPKPRVRGPFDSPPRVHHCSRVSTREMGYPIFPRFFPATKRVVFSKPALLIRAILVQRVYVQLHTCWYHGLFPSGPILSIGFSD